MDERTISSLLSEYSLVVGVSGMEPTTISAKLKSDLSPHVQTEQDLLGNVYGFKGGTESNPRILVEAHIDEIGMMVTSIDESGFLRFRQVGRWPTESLVSHPVVVHGDGGDIPGVLGIAYDPQSPERGTANPASEGHKPFVDVGAYDRDTALEWGIRPGNFISPWPSCKKTADGRRIFGKAWDNRAGVALLAALGRTLSTVDHPNEVLLAGISQEEVGKRGIKVAMNRLRDIDVALVLEGILGTDTPGMDPERSTDSRLGYGANVMLSDRGHPWLSRFIVDVAHRHGLSCQPSVGYGGSDADEIHVREGGIPTIVIGVPCRYIHNHVGLIDTQDFAITLELLKEIIVEMDSATLARISSQ